MLASSKWPGCVAQVCLTAEEAVSSADVIFTQTPGSKPVVELGWLKKHATIIASGEPGDTSERPWWGLERGRG
jgi:ornithine cyclodeaminase/alanine dehydrogenase-like protein (mu-crystallin family)